MSARRKWEEPKAGAWVQPVPRGYKLRCCDCGLVHTMDFRVIKWAGGARTKVQFRVRDRDERATAAIRREARKRA